MEGPEKETFPYVIRRAVDADSRGILACLRAAFESYRESCTAAAYEDTVLTPKTLAERLATMVVLVAVDRDEMILGTVRGIDLGGEGHIRGMAVLPQAQGSGIAGRLLGTIEAKLRDRGCSTVGLDTTAPLARAIRFYERSGYRASGKVTDFFGMRLYEYTKRL